MGENIVITIARQYGSGGKTIGAMLAKELGINCYSREILKMASEESGINEGLFGMSDEKIKKAPWFKILNRPYDGELLTPEDRDFVSDDNLFNYQAKVIKELAAQESCVIIGRCADYLLRDDPDVIKLYFCAPKKDCVARVMNQNGLSEKEAERRIEKIDKYRAEYYRYYTGRDWNDARNYNFCLDTTSMSYEKLVEVVTNFIQIYQK